MQFEIINDKNVFLCHNNLHWEFSQKLVIFKRWDGSKDKKI